MDQIYEVVNGFSEGFFIGVTPEEKSKMLKQSGLTIVYAFDFTRRIFFDTKVNTKESKIIMDNKDQILKEVPREEFNKAYESCSESIGLYEKTSKPT